MSDAFGTPRNPGGQSSGMFDAASNLVAKAVIALDGGDLDKAMGYIRRAERLPYDDEGGAAPLSLAAHMYALQTVLDVHDLGGGAWIDAAAEILGNPVPSWKPLALADFRHVLRVVQRNYSTTSDEDRRVRALVAGQRVATIREMQELVGEQLSAVTADLLEIVVEYELRAEGILAERRTD